VLIPNRQPLPAKLRIGDSHSSSDELTPNRQPQPAKLRTG
jgi:hypothetical protein